jgi:arsenate reductase
MQTVIFACVHNAGRSQMAAAFFNLLADPSEARAISAGTEPALRVHPEVLEVMKEVGIDLSEARPQKLTDELARQGQLLITMGCGDQCPYVPGLRRDDWPLPDPKGRSIEEVRNVRNEIRTRVYDLLKAEGLSLAESLHGRAGPPPDHSGANKDPGA